MKIQITIVTGASSNHFLPLQSLLWTIAKFEPSARVIIYDLGLTAEERLYSFSTSNCEWRTFDFAKYPAHFALGPDAGRMAFRPTVLAEVAHELSTTSPALAAINSQLSTVLLWLDAGCQIRRSLAALTVQVMKRGYHCELTAQTVGEKLYPSAFSPLGISTLDPRPSTLLSLPLRDAGICAFDISRPDVMALLDRWAAVALDPAITAPAGSTRWTHRQDAVFTVLLHQFAAQYNWDLEAPKVEGLKMRCDDLTLIETRYRVEGK